MVVATAELFSVSVLPAALTSGPGPATGEEFSDRLAKGLVKSAPRVTATPLNWAAPPPVRVFCWSNAPPEMVNVRPAPTSIDPALATDTPAPDWDTVMSPPLTRMAPLLANEAPAPDWVT